MNTKAAIEQAFREEVRLRARQRKMGRGQFTHNCELVIDSEALRDRVNVEVIAAAWHRLEMAAIYRIIRDEWPAPSEPPE